MEFRASSPRRDALPRVLAGYGASLVAVAATSGVIGALHLYPAVPNISVLYLIVVLAAATLFGRGPAVAASIVAFLAFDWFVVPPVGRFTVDSPGEWVALVVFLLTGLIAAQLADAQRRHARDAERRAGEAGALADIALATATESSPEGILLAGVTLIWRLCADAGATAAGVLLVTDGGPTAVVAPMGPGAERPLRRDEDAAIPYVLRERSPVVLPAHEGDADSVVLLPLVSGPRALGVLRLLLQPSRARAFPLTANTPDGRFLAAACGQLALAVDRAMLRQEETRAEVLTRTDALRAALMSSVSHDLRTPLATIKAAAGSLLEGDLTWSDESRRDFARTIEREADRLNRLVENLLDLSKIEAGVLQVDFRGRAKIA